MFGEDSCVQAAEKKMETKPEIRKWGAVWQSNEKSEGGRMGDCTRLRGKQLTKLQDDAKMV